MRDRTMAREQDLVAGGSPYVRGTQVGMSMPANTNEMSKLMAFQQAMQREQAAADGTLAGLEALGESRYPATYQGANEYRAPQGHPVHPGMTRSEFLSQQQQQQQRPQQPNIAQLAQQRASGALAGTLSPGQEVGGWAQGQLAAMRGGLKKDAKMRTQRTAGKGKGARRAPTKTVDHAARIDTKSLQKSAAAGSNYDGTLLSLVISARKQAANNQMSFVPVYDYKSNRLALVRSDGVDMVYNMSDRRHRDALRSGLLKAKYDPTQVMRLADSVSAPLKKAIAQDINTEEDVIEALRKGYL